VERLSALDATFLEVEDADRRHPMAIASAAVFAGPAPAQEKFVEAIRLKLPHIPRYRQKVRRVPMDLHRPVWVDDPDFDIGYHVRRAALPEPGGDEQLAALMATVAARRMDRRRPLWEYWVVDGLADGHWALISKVHHAMVDGVSGTHLYNVICDGQVASIDEPWAPGPEPSALRLAAAAVADLAMDPLTQARAVAGLARDPRALAERVTTTVRGLSSLAAAAVPTTPTSLVGPIGEQRRYAMARSSFADLKAVKERYGCTVNDVVLAAITGAFRQVLLARGEEPDPRALRSLVPVSVRAPGQEGTYENRVSVMLPFLPVDIADPVLRLNAVHTTLAELKASRQAESGEVVSRLADHEPFGPLALGMRAFYSLPQRNISTVTTNVPGPRTPLTLLGRPMLEMFPYVPIATTIRVGIAISTYCDKVTFGVTADHATVPDAGALAQAVEEELTTLAKGVN
jgi:WS/DGAT/MGAT family acyltransferase